MSDAPDYECPICRRDSCECERTRPIVKATSYGFQKDGGGTSIQTGTFQIRVASSWWDYETGWHYRGSVALPAPGWDREVYVSEFDLEDAR
jgi:hypothetical protein